MAAVCDSQIAKPHSEKSYPRMAADCALFAVYIVHSLVCFRFLDLKMAADCVSSLRAMLYFPVPDPGSRI